MLLYFVVFLIALFNARVDKKHGDGKLSAKMGPFLNPTTPLHFLPSIGITSPRHSDSFTMAELNLQEIHDLLITVAHEAGRMMMAATPSYLSSGTKKNCSSYLTTTHNTANSPSRRSRHRDRPSS
jgi:hypothetical protein